MTETQPTNTTGLATKAIPFLVAAAGVLAGLALMREPAQPPQKSTLPPTAQFDLEHIRRVAHQTPIYREAESISCNGMQAECIASDTKTRLYVGGASSVHVFDFEGTQRKQIALPAPAKTMTLGEDGTLWVASETTLLTVNVKNNMIGSMPLPGKDCLITSIASDSERIYLADARQRVIHVFTRAENAWRIIGKKNKARKHPGFIIPSPHFDIALAPDGLLRATNPGRHRIEAYTATGDMEWFWGTASALEIEGFCGCCNPTDIAVFPDGRVATAEKGIPRIKIYDAEGGFLGLVAGPNGFDKKNAGFDLAVADDGRIFALDRIQEAVRVFSPIAGSDDEPAEN